MSIADYHRAAFVDKKLKTFLTQQFVDTELLKEFLITFRTFLLSNPTQLYNVQTFIHYLDLISKIGTILTTEHKLEHIKLFIHLLFQIVLLFKRFTPNVVEHMCVTDMFSTLGRTLGCQISLTYLKPMFVTAIYTFALSALNIPTTRGNNALNGQLLHAFQTSRILDKCFKEFSEIGMPETLASCMTSLNKSMLFNTNVGNIDPQKAIRDITRYFNAMSNQLKLQSIDLS